MPQQINLCTPILLTQKRYFSAQTMAIALSVFLVLGAILCGTWVWNLDQATASFKRAVTANAHELESLQAALVLSRASAAPADPALLAQLQERRNTLTQREKLREALKEGMFRPGWGHSARLEWVARSIPAPIWITEVRLDQSRFEAAGFTLEPAALNVWVDKLSVSPLMQDLKLATVKVENATAAIPRATASAAPAASTPSSPVPEPARAVWSFNLVSSGPLAAASAAASATGSRP